LRHANPVADEKRRLGHPSEHKKIVN